VEISAVIVTLNDEKRLGSALNSLGGIASEIVIVDCGSTDGTLRIAAKHTSSIHERTGTDRTAQRNWAVSLASHPWILTLLPDETISSDLRDELFELKAQSPECAAFSAPTRAFYLGRWVRHSGWAPGRRIRLFQKGLAHWEDDAVYERLEVDGPVRKLRGPVHRFPYATISVHAARINRDSDLAAHKLYALKKKARFARLLLAPPAVFLKTYFLRFGILDGFPGLVIAYLDGYASFLRSAKLREIWKKGERIEPFPD
jgi:glycosyltransferase involved in cell wall biosynthesis